MSNWPNTTRVRGPRDRQRAGTQNVRRNISIPSFSRLPCSAEWEADFRKVRPADKTSRRRSVSNGLLIIRLPNVSPARTTSVAITRRRLRTTPTNRQFRYGHAYRVGELSRKPVRRRFYAPFSRPNTFRSILSARTRGVRMTAKNRSFPICIQIRFSATVDSALYYNIRFFII